MLPPMGDKVSPNGLPPATAVSEGEGVGWAAFGVAGWWRYLGLIGLLGLLLRSRGIGCEGKVRLVAWFPFSFRRRG